MGRGQNLLNLVKKIKQEKQIKEIRTEIAEVVKPENLKAGVTAFGIDGTFTSDATATATDILFGETAYVNGIKITGTYEGNAEEGGIKITDAGYLFYQNKRIEYLYELLSLCENVINMSYMFAYCNSLTELNLSSFDTSKVVDISYMFHYCNSLVDLKFGKNLGKGYARKIANYNYYKLDLLYSPLLTHESLISVINGIYDLNLTYNVAGGGTLYRQNLNLGSTNLAKLTEEEIAIATSKGWNVT